MAGRAIFGAVLPQAIRAAADRAGDQSFIAWPSFFLLLSPIFAAVLSLLVAILFFLPLLITILALILCLASTSTRFAIPPTIRAQRILTTAGRTVRLAKMYRTGVVAVRDAYPGSDYTQMFHVATVPNHACMVYLKTFPYGSLVVLPNCPMHHNPAIIEAYSSIAVICYGSDPNVTAGLLIDHNLFKQVVNRVPVPLTCAFTATKTSRREFSHRASF